jgi:hypothetical protein
MPINDRELDQSEHYQQSGEREPFKVDRQWLGDVLAFLDTTTDPGALPLKLRAPHAIVGPEVPFRPL